MKSSVRELTVGDRVYFAHGYHNEIKTFKITSLRQAPNGNQRAFLLEHTEWCSSTRLILTEQELADKSWIHKPCWWQFVRIQTKPASVHTEVIDTELVQ